MALPKVSPSRLDRLDACPRFVQVEHDENKNADSMDAGIRFHSTMESIAKSDDPVVEIAKITDFNDRRAAEYAWGQVSGLLAAGFVVAGVEQEFPESSVCRRGFADLVLVCEDTMVIVDWKMTRAEGRHNMQMRAYAIAAFEHHPSVAVVRSLVIAPLIQHTEETVYTRDRLADQLLAITTLMERVENPFTPGAPSDVCAGCKWSGRCPAQCKELSLASETYSMPLSQAELLSPTTAEGRARRRYFADWLGSAIDGIKDDDLAYVKAGNEPPTGYKLVTKAGRSTLIQEKVPEAIDRLVGQGFSLDQIHGACTLYTSKLAKSLSPVLGEDEDALKKRLDASVADLMTVGSPSIYLQRTSKKTLQELFQAMTPTMLNP